MNQFFSYWYGSSAPRFFDAYTDTVASTEETFAVRQTMANISKPLFQDYTLGGRVVGVLMRLARIAAGLICYSVMAVLFAVAYLAWLAFPLVCIVSLLGSLIGSKV